MKKLILILLLSFGILLAHEVSGQRYEHADSAYAESREHKRPLLLFFSGSDWCPHCQRFEKSILMNSEFQSFARNRLVILQLDFPQRKKQPAELKKQNEALAEKYNPRGIFPAILLLNSDRSRSVTYEYKNQDPQEFAEWINKQAELLQSHD